MFKLSTNQKEQILKIEYFKHSMYSNLLVEETLIYMVKRYVNPLQKVLEIRDSSLIDCGCGFGWLSFAYLLSGGKSATLCEIDGERLNAAKKIAQILQLDTKCTFITSPLQNLSTTENSFDIFVSVETLEHVGEKNIDSCIEIISRTAKKAVILTTPNKLFPLVFHDNKIPMSHWLPVRYRKKYLKLFHGSTENMNDFVPAWKLGPIREKFRPVSRVLTFQSYKEWVSSYPFYSPYNKENREKLKPPFLLKALYFILSILFNKNSYLVSPNLCRLWVVKKC
jgi:2-polyprenyl-3-methyl-5-hydroxy-6-metoxy-1,4-benzoquinol methylase